MKLLQAKNILTRHYSLCCPPRKPPGKCGGQKGGGRKIVPPPHCNPSRIPYNPCVPEYHEGKDTWKKYMYFFCFVSLPVIVILSLKTLGEEPPPKGSCRDYEYMRIRSKRFPWGSGVESLFHNPHTNHLPGECEVPPLVCDD